MRTEMSTLINNINTAINTAKEQQGNTYNYIEHSQEIKLIPDNWKDYFYDGPLDLSSDESAYLNSEGGLGCYLINTPTFPTSGTKFTGYYGLYRMFSNCKKLTSVDLSKLVCSSASSAQGMFRNCTNLRQIKNWTWTNAGLLIELFQSCTALKTLDLSNIATKTSSGTVSLTRMFEDCSSLTSLNIPQFALDRCNDVTDMFDYCSSLTTITGTNAFKNLGKNYSQKTANYSKYKLNLSPATNLAHDSIMLIINNLYDLNTTYGATLYTQTLQLGTTNLNKLTTEEKAIATTKGWTLS